MVQQYRIYLLIQEMQVQSLIQKDAQEKEQWQPTSVFFFSPSPVFLSGESHGQRSLTDYSPWGLKELDMTEVTEQQPHLKCTVFET